MLWLSVLLPNSDDAVHAEARFLAPHDETELQLQGCGEVQIAASVIPPSIEGVRK